MIIPTFQGVVNKGVLQVEARFYPYLASLEGQKVEIVVRKRRSKRSGQQNRYYWGVVVKMLADKLGYEPEEMHYALRVKFLGEEEDRYGLKKIRSTTELSTKEFIEVYTEPIKRWAAEFLCFRIPDPNEVDF